MALFSLAACAARPDLSAEREAILSTDREWARAAAERDLDRIVSFWADDAILLPPGEPARIGKEAIRAFVASSLSTPEFGIRWETTEVTVSASGDFAYAFGTNRITVPGPESSPITIPGRGITIWRKEPGGAWRCVVDIWNEEPGGAAVEATAGP
jgi:uncharacterized protein (TIGR02246 family)